MARPPEPHAPHRISQRGGGAFQRGTASPPDLYIHETSAITGFGFDMNFAKSLDSTRQLSDALHFPLSQPPSRFVPYAMHPPANYLHRSEFLQMSRIHFLSVPPRFQLTTSFVATEAVLMTGISKSAPSRAAFVLKQPCATVSGKMPRVTQ
jgi:hypothetical protein